MSTTYRSCISKEDLDSLATTDGMYNWRDHMNEVAIASSEAGNLKPKSKAARSAAVSVAKVRSTGTRDESGTTIPLTSLPGYAEAKRKADEENSQSYKALCSSRSLSKTFLNRIDQEANAYAAASSSKRVSELYGRPRQQVVTRVIRSNAPSDSTGCWKCHGDHYARECPLRANPYGRR